MEHNIAGQHLRCSEQTHNAAKFFEWSPHSGTSGLTLRAIEEQAA